MKNPRTCNFLFFFMLFTTLGYAQMGEVTMMLPESDAFVVYKPGEEDPVPLHIGDLVFEGGLIFSSEEGSSLTLQCPSDEESTFLINGPTIFLLQRGTSNNNSENTCGIYLQFGDVDVISDLDTYVSTTLANIASRGTTYSVSVRNTGSSLSNKLQVFDGKIEVETNFEKEELTSGNNLDIGIGGQSKTIISEMQYLEKAEYLSYHEFKKAEYEGKITSEDHQKSTLTNLYLNVLKNPEQKKSRVELAKFQDDIGQVKQAGYNFKRSNIRENDFETYNIKPSQRVYMERANPGQSDKKQKKQIENKSRQSALDLYKLSMIYIKERNYARGREIAKAALAEQEHNAVLTTQQVKELKMVIERYK